MGDNLKQRNEAGEAQIAAGERAYARAIAAAEGDFIEYPDRVEGSGMCEHGFIGACAECDGSGQIPEPAEPVEERVVTCPECAVVGIPHTISRDGHAFISTPTGLAMACSPDGRRVNGGKAWNK